MLLLGKLRRSHDGHSLDFALWILAGPELLDLSNHALMRTEDLFDLLELFLHLAYVGDLHPFPVFLEALVHQIGRVESPVLPYRYGNAPDPLSMCLYLTPPRSLPWHHCDRYPLIPI